MKTTMDWYQAGEQAAASFGAGYHCAEAVVATFLEVIGEDNPQAIAHATAFGGGFGKTFCEACGVLSGGMLAIGHLYGRRERGEDWDMAAELGAEFRQRFIESNGTTLCSVLRKRFGPEQQMHECRRLVREGTVALLHILNDAADEGQPDDSVAGAEAIC